VTEISGLFTGNSNVQDAVDGGAYPLFDRSSVIKRSDKWLFDGEAIIVPGEGKEFVPRYYNGKFNLHQRAYALIPHTETTDARYVYYAVFNQRDHFSRIAVGSTVKSLRRASFETMMIPFPTIEEQRTIAGTLSALDDKIAINTKINRNLEQMAQAIFKSWFVDFEPFGGERPLNWHEGTISDISDEIVCGKTPSTKNKDNFGNDVPFITIPDMHNVVYITATQRSLSFVGAKTQNSKTVPENSVCVSCIATAGLVALTSVPSQTNQQINTIVCKEGISPYFVYLTMVGMSDHIRMLGSSGSATINLNKGQFSKIELLIPESCVIGEFNDLIEPIFGAIKYNQQENTKLANLRDTLLPRLMSGEISVADLTTK